jgi:cell division septum initiation protein DivIVA
MTRSLTPQQIQNAELPRSLRGFDVEVTRNLLARAAESLSAAVRERDDLRQQLAALVAQTPVIPTDAETIGAVLLTAKRAADELLTDASQKAAAIRADAETERTEMLAQARAQADALSSDAAATLTALRDEDESLRRSISANREEFVTFLRSALEQLERVESVGHARPAAQPGLDGELLAQLPTE